MVLAGLIRGACAVGLAATPLAVSTAWRGASEKAFAFSTVFDAHFVGVGGFNVYYAALKRTPSLAPIPPRWRVPDPFGPLVQTHAGQFSRQRSLAVRFGADAEHHPARVGLLSLLADLGTSFEVILDRFVEGLPQVLHRFSMDTQPGARSNGPLRTEERACVPQSRGGLWIGIGLAEALEGYGIPEIFNTDQDSQFTSIAFTGQLEATGIRCSMDGRGRCLDNVFIERLWRSLKYEAVYLHELQDGFEAQRVIDAWMAFYNETRPHSALGGRTPAEAYRDGVAEQEQEVA